MTGSDRITIRRRKDSRMAHLTNHIHESIGVADPEIDAPDATLPDLWLDRLPAILDALRRPETVTPAVALLVEMARAADAKKSPEA